MTIEHDVVELLSIKTKSLEELDCGTLTENQKPAKQTKILHENLCNENESHCYDSEDDDNENDDDDDHYDSTVRFIKIDKSPNGACGFHLTRTKWDPYPWVSAVDDYTPAAKTDLKAGDCILEVNGCDVLGLRITEIAKLVKSSQHQVTLLLWSTNCNTKCNEESLCAAPMPRTLQRLSLVVQSVLSLIECPVCRDTITPPAMQCQNGHLLCVNCRIRAEKCPVCRDRYYPRPALIAEQLQAAITSAFNLCRNEDKVRQKIFGRHRRQQQMVSATLKQLQQQHLHEQQEQEQHQSLKALHHTAEQTSCIRKVTDRRSKCHKFLTKLLTSKAYSMENLTNGHNNALTTTTTTTSAIQDHKQQQCKNAASVTNQLLNDCKRIPDKNIYLFSPPNNNYKLQANAAAISMEDINWSINSKPCCQQQIINNNRRKQVSTSLNNLTSTTTASCLLEPAMMGIASIRPCPAMRVYGTPYATIPRAIKPQENEGERGTTASSMTSLNLSLSMSLPSSAPSCSRCHSLVTNSTKSLSIATNGCCQSSLSSSAPASAATPLSSSHSVVSS
ncbi:hypothetical protein DOY81_002657 [Sarcophaga bullata]|nr:hypothetical protein DOY81_002657 [Sarcophaga bullata]